MWPEPLCLQACPARALLCSACVYAALSTHWETDSPQRGAEAGATWRKQRKEGSASAEHGEGRGGGNPGQSDLAAPCSTILKKSLKNSAWRPTEPGGWCNRTTCTVLKPALLLMRAERDLSSPSSLQQGIHQAGSQELGQHDWECLPCAKAVAARRTQGSSWRVRVPSNR